MRSMPHTLRRPVSPAVLAVVATTTALSCTGSETTLKASNVDPQVGIQAPLDGDVYSELDTIDLVAQISDGNGLDDLVSVILTSSELGEIQQLAPDSSGIARWSGTLPAGDHTLTVQATDQEGASGQASVSIQITARDRLPTASITSPDDLDTFEAGDNIALIGEAGDPVEDVTTLLTTWSYEPTDGGAPVEIASGSPASSGIVEADWLDAPAGRWKLIFEVTDEEGLTATDQITVTIDELSGGDTFDDDGDCYCESPDTCLGSASPDCTELGFDDCDDDDVLLSPEDLDGDGASTCEGDCDDDDDLRFPGNPEVALDGIDQDCDGVDDCYMDLDDDGFGDGIAPGATLSCDGPFDAVVDGDCDDDDENAYPGAPELTADGIDQDCDGTEACYLDEDTDGFGILTLATNADLTCSAVGVADNADDCNDDDPAIRPTATELLADGVDQNCDLQELCHTDIDTDGFGGASTGLSSTLDCSQVGFAADTTDCNDGDGTVFPGATEVAADGVDQDCNNLELCYEDLDRDSVGGTTTTESPLLSCMATGLATTNTDCDDDDDTSFPGAVEVVQDGIDQDCDGNDECFEDPDGDGYGDLANTVPGVGLVCPTVVVDGDCDDAVSTTNPGAPELVANGVDDDCDTLEACYADDDGDSFGGDLFTVTSADLDCADVGEFSVADDCDDTDDSTFPGAADIPEMSFVDSNCDGVDGDAARAVFVANSGSDLSVTCDQASPCATVDEALTRLGGTTDQVLVQAGTYGLLDLDDDAAIYGGYQTDWSRQDVLAGGTPSTFVGEDVGADPQSMALRADNISGAHVQNVQLLGSDVTARAGNGVGKSSYGAWVKDSDVVIENSDILAGRGADGASGTDATDLTVRAPAGAFGLDGTNGGACGGLSAHGGGNGGSNTCDGVDVSGGDGGNSGTANCSNASPATDGQDGDDGLGPSSGNGGDGGDQSNTNLALRHGDNGIRGTNGSNGNAGGAGSGGTVNTGFWSATRSVTGGDGTNGAGGGGGGGGAGAETFLTEEGRGGTGGGGGAGGCGGDGGQGGAGGGASVGVFAHGSTLELPGTSVTAGDGGDGGNGGDGGQGQTGGIGRAGGDGVVMTTKTTGDGGNGGGGGNGGDGAGGSAGAGGPSWAVVLHNSTVDTLTAALQAGTAGDGGRGGLGAGTAANGPDGQNGPEDDEHTCASAFDCW